MDAEVIRYLSGVSNEPLRRVAKLYDIGLMVQPGNGYARQIAEYPTWAADNACFAQGDRFDLARYLLWLRELKDAAGTCLFATAPDELLRYDGRIIGDAYATWRRSALALGLIRAEGFPAALVAQNGLQIVGSELWAAVDYGGGRRVALEIPWAAFDALFLGGDNVFKLWRTSTRALVAAAKARGKWVHMGRVNSAVRLLLAQRMGCDSADGTYLKYAARESAERGVLQIVDWLEAARRAAAPRLDDQMELV